jgi:aryl-alcohol dehydrogenase-like predicted oxidoreductase
LTDRGDAPAEFRGQARALGVGVDALAIAAALAQPWADVVLSGAATVPQLDSNLNAIEVALRDDILEKMLGETQSPDDYWAARSTLPWN